MVDKKCTKNKISPNLAFKNIMLPTEEIKNIGDDDEQNALALTASASPIKFFSFKSATVFAPTG